MDLEAEKWPALGEMDPELDELIKEREREEEEAKAKKEEKEREKELEKEDEKETKDDNDNDKAAADADADVDVEGDDGDDEDDEGIPEDLVEQRKLFAKWAKEAAEKQDITGIEEVESTVEARDGYHIPIRIHSPTTAPEDGSPLIVFIHGGGFCLGSLDSDITHTRNFVRYLDAVVVTVDYRLSPEHPFPTPVNDGWDVVKWAAKNVEKLGADSSKGFIVGGVSAGAGISSAVSRLAQKEKLSPPLTGLCLLVPPIFGQSSAVPEQYRSIVTSYEQNKDAVLLDAEAVQKFMDAYKPVNDSPLFNNFAPGETLKGLPPVFLQVCGSDPLRDEALIYEYILRNEYGIPTRLEIYPGLPHGFWIIYTKLKATKKFLEDTVDGMAWLLKRERKELPPKEDETTEEGDAAEDEAAGDAAAE